MVGINARIMKHKPLPSLEKINELLEYNRETGEFNWKVSRGPIKAGETAGQKWVDYIRIKIDGKSYQAHRLAWLIITGCDPAASMVHHKDADKQNNKADNLELATPSENACITLRGEPKCYQRTGNRRQYFQACYTLDKKKITLGTFKTAEEACKVGREARRIARGFDV